jgi:hypothetical protein
VIRNLTNTAPASPWPLTRYAILQSRYSRNCCRAILFGNEQLMQALSSSLTCLLPGLLKVFDDLDISSSKKSCEHFDAPNFPQKEQLSEV